MFTKLCSMRYDRENFAAFSCIPISIYKYISFDRPTWEDIWRWIRPIPRGSSCIDGNCAKLHRWRSIGIFNLKSVIPPRMGGWNAHIYIIYTLGCEVWITYLEGCELKRDGISLKRNFIYRWEFDKIGHEQCFSDLNWNFVCHTVSFF